jgi:hypothetical protein
MGRPLEEFDVHYELKTFGLELGHKNRPGEINDHPQNIDYQDWDTAELDDYRLGNKELPIFEFKDQIIEAVADNPVTILVAETGAGKSTQVPQFLLETGRYETIYITQPRRAAARNVHERLCHEIGQKRGISASEDLVNFQTAHERKGPDDATIQVVTDGLHLVRELHGKGIVEDEVLIIDEVHEWNSNVEVLVAYTKMALLENPKLKIVLTSATVDADHLADYYTSVNGMKPPIIEVPGRTFEVHASEEPESTVVDEVIKIVNSFKDEEGGLKQGTKGILVFEPGRREIDDAINQISKRIPKAFRDKVVIFPLHARLSRHQQQAAIESYDDRIKIVVATEVAETSLTIPDIKYVVDSGLHRQSDIDDEGVKGLGQEVAAKAKCDQRKGRTGRVEDGYYILTRMDKKTDFVPYTERPRFSSPEILRSDLQRFLLKLKLLDIEMVDLDMCHPVSETMINIASKNLELLDALDEDGNVTSIGERMDQYPVCTSSARIMVESMGYSPAVRNYLAAIVAVKEVGGLPLYDYKEGKPWLELTAEQNSDLLAQLDLFIAVQDMPIFMRRMHGLDGNNFERAKEHFDKIARLAGAPGGKLVPPTDEQREEIRRCSYVGYLSSIYEYAGEGMYVHMVHKGTRTLREVSNRSFVETAERKPAILLADPWRAERFKGSVPEPWHLLENVTIPVLQDLGAVAIRYTSDTHEGFVFNEGKVTEKRVRRLFNRVIGKPVEVPAQPSPALRAKIIEETFKNPGAELRKLLDLQKELERLDRIAKDPVQRLSRNIIDDLVHESAPADITTPATIEDNLRLAILDPERAITIDQFVSEERREEIIANAPNMINVEGLTLMVSYSDRKPIVHVRNPAQFLEIEADELYLPDGREVLFAFTNQDGNTRRYRLNRLKYAIEANSEVSFAR